MKKAYPKRLPKAKPDPVNIKFNAAQVRQNTLVMPEISYEVVANTEMKEVFTGEITPMPTALIFYLNHVELMIVTVLMDEMMKNGGCSLAVKDIAKRICVTDVTINNAMVSLRKSGLLIEKKNGMKGNGKIRSVNYEALQHLNDVLEGENPGIYARIRRNMRKRNILNITKEDVWKAYNNKILPPEHDPIEEEEYD